ncbi:HAMP domain-containing histidine kinase [Paraburkholderia sp. Tr-20389]|uniref:sensor histidine kinase n=1 Tax=Paraburkholderia sp. Tr-20389 TaxID=2703903 RepID=UPI00197FA4F2|nr:HAMP domain-containing sensor histidine kinase [Paraburkholderia sp. Tr-20389]MBN3754747.1 HAMP domain-containing histidine kinase [Paraburkholderia sp. Tr-20389]
MLLLGYIGLSVTNTMERATDVVMDWQLIYFDSMPIEELPQAIHRRLEHERMHTNYYGLFDANGKHIAGDVIEMPPSVSIDRHGKTLDRTLKIAGNEQAPVVRAKAELRANGETLLIARDLTHIFGIRETIFRALIGGGFLCLTAGVLSALALSLNQMRRIKAIRRITQRIAQGDLGQRLPVGGRDEIDMLSSLVNHMLDEVERLMNEVKGACDGIAHDLRTPLAHVRSLLVRISERGGRHQDEALYQLIDDARRETDALLDRFRAMLRISEIGTLQRRGGFGEVNLEALVQEVGELFEPLAESREIGFAVTTSPVEAIHGDRALLFEALSNLLDNAIKFTPDGGKVRIELKRMPSGAQIDVIDNGPGIPADERDAVLQRFYRGERTRHLAGSGLGLSIVSAVINVHDFSMHIADASPGTRITIECRTKTLT